MAPQSRSLQAVVAVLTLLGSSCLQNPNPTNPVVFVGGYVDNVNYNPFSNSSAADVTPDATTCFPGTTLYCPVGEATLKVVVPGPGSVTNQFAGGAFLAAPPRNLSGFDAVSFWAKGTVRGAPFVVGLGSDLTPTALYLAEGSAELDTTWTQYILPIPNPAKLTAEAGLFYISAGAVGSPGVGFTFWLADIQYVKLGSALGGPGAVMPPSCVQTQVGNPAFAAFLGTAPDKILVNFAVDTERVTVNASRRYFTFTSSDPAVATVDVEGMVSIQGAGTATVTAQLGTSPATGPLTVLVNSNVPCPPLPVPTTIPPTPTVPAANVISLYSSAYPPNNTINWHTSWSVCCSDYAPFNIPQPSGPYFVKSYTLRTYAGIEFIGPGGADEIDASQMTHFHLDVWTPNAFAFDVQLVNDPGGYQSSSNVTLQTGPTTGQWVGFDIPMTAFNGLGGTNKLGQLLFIVPGGTSSTIYVDNIYFHN